jgi:hypothetical protein
MGCIDGQLIYISIAFTTGLHNASAERFSSRLITDKADFGLVSLLKLREIIIFHSLSCLCNELSPRSHD